MCGYEKRGFSSYTVTEHAREEMEKRQISAEQLHQVVTNQGQVERITETRQVSQAVITLRPKKYLLRAFIDTDRSLPAVVTIYRTSKIRKYWRDAP